MRLRVSYDPTAGCACVHLGAARRVVRTVELDDQVYADMDEHGEVVSVEFIGVSAPELEMLDPLPAAPRRIQDIKIAGTVL